MRILKVYTTGFYCKFRFPPNCGLGITSITILVIAVLYHTLSLGNKATSFSETRKEELINNRSNVIRVMVHAKPKSPSHKEVTTNFSHPYFIHKTYS